MKKIYAKGYLKLFSIGIMCWNVYHAIWNL